MTARKGRAELPALAVQRPDGLSFDLPKNAVTRWNRSLAPAAAAAEDERRIDILDFIGPEEWGGVSAKRIARELKDAGNIVVYINSPGGDLFEGVAIYNLLREHDGNVRIKVIGLAASAASVIAMAGDDVEIGRTAWMMIHNVWVLAIGNRHDLRKFADELETFDDGLAALYAARTGRTKKKMAQMMDGETWFDGEHAIDEGFADALLPADEVGRKDPDEDEEEYNRLASRIDASLIKGGVPRTERMTMMNQLRGALSARRGAQPTEEHMPGNPAAPAAPAAPATPAAAPAAPAAAPTAAPDPAAPAAPVDARARVKAILALPEAKGREGLANHLALETDLPVEQAKASLAASPKANRMDDAMQRFQPRISSQEVEDGDRPKIDPPATVYERMNRIYREANRVK